MYTRSTELYHYGVKGMKWGVRRAEKKKAKKQYRSAKRKAAVSREKATGKYNVDVAKATNSYAYGGKSIHNMHQQLLSATRQKNKAYAKSDIDRAAAKRDYRIAKGKNADRANRKYDKAVRSAKSQEESRNQQYINELYMKNPFIARSLAKSGDISVSNLKSARINAGFEAVNTILELGSMYSKYKRQNGQKG